MNLHRRSLDSLARNMVRHLQERNIILHASDSPRAYAALRDALLAEHDMQRAHSQFQKLDTRAMSSAEAGHCSVRRVIEYNGPVEWVRATLEASIPARMDLTTDRYLRAATIWPDTLAPHTVHAYMTGLLDEAMEADAAPGTANTGIPVGHPATVDSNDLRPGDSFITDAARALDGAGLAAIASASPALDSDLPADSTGK